MPQLSDEGEVNVVLNMQRVLSRHDGPKDLGGLLSQYLYIAVLVQEDTGATQPASSGLLDRELSLMLENLIFTAQVESARRRSLLRSSSSTRPTPWTSCPHPLSSSLDSPTMFRCGVCCPSASQQEEAS